MWAMALDQARLTVRVTEGDQLLPEQHHAHRVAVGSRQLAREQGGHPVFAHQLSHRGLRSDAADGVVVDLAQHKGVSFQITRCRPASRARAACACTVFRPFGSRGSASVKSMLRGSLNFANRVPRNAKSSSATVADGRTPWVSSTTALTSSPHFSFGMPKTATSATVG